MYDQDVPAISYHARTPQGMADVITFALLSIRQPFSSLAKQMRDVRAVKEKSEYLWGMKRQGYIDARNNADVLCQDNACLDTPDLMYSLHEAVTGLGVVKAGFVCQMLGRNVGCLDSRNQYLYGIKHRAAYLRLDDVNPNTQKRRIRRYVNKCNELGGAEVLWNSWCTSVAPSLSLSPDEVSWQHQRIITGKRYRWEGYRDVEVNEGVPF